MIVLSYALAVCFTAATLAACFALVFIALVLATEGCVRACKWFERKRLGL